MHINTYINKIHLYDINGYTIVYKIIDRAEIEPVAYEVIYVALLCLYRVFTKNLEKQSFKRY